MLKAGIIGTGRISKSHIEAIGKIRDIEISCVCDIIEEAANKAAQSITATAYTDYREMMEKEKPDAVWICTPANVHTENVLFCIEQNTPFFLEKPVSMSIEEGERTAKKISESGIYHSVGYMLRYSPAVDKLKEILDCEQVVFWAAEYFWTIPLVDSIKSKENAGGQIVDQATHLVDLMRYIGGEIKSVYTCRSRGFFPEEKLYTGDDASATVFEFENGISGNLVCTYALFPEITEHYPPRIRVICKKKMVEYTDNKLNVITRQKQESIRYKADTKFLEDKAFVEGIIKKDRSRVRSSYEDALKTLKVCLAANKSMETGKKIQL